MTHTRLARSPTLVWATSRCMDMTLTPIETAWCRPRLWCHTRTPRKSPSATVALSTPVSSLLQTLTYSRPPNRWSHPTPELPLRTLPRPNSNRASEHLGGDMNVCTTDRYNDKSNLHAVITNYSNFDKRFLTTAANSYWTLTVIIINNYTFIHFPSHFS